MANAARKFAHTNRLKAAGKALIPSHDSAPAILYQFAIHVFCAFTPLAPFMCCSYPFSANVVFSVSFACLAFLNTTQLMINHLHYNSIYSHTWLRFSSSFLLSCAYFQSYVSSRCSNIVLSTYLAMSVPTQSVQDTLQALKTRLYSLQEM